MAKLFADARCNEAITITVAFLGKTEVERWRYILQRGGQVGGGGAAMLFCLFLVCKGCRDVLTNWGRGGGGRPPPLVRETWCNLP